MSKKYTVAFATGSRADYGIMKNFLKLLDQDSEIELKILTTGALLDDEYGHQVDLIYQDGFHVDIEVKTNIDTRSDVSIIHMMSEIQENFADYFAQTKLDLLMLLGDRYEMLSVAIAAAMQKIPILHVHGGEGIFRFRRIPGRIGPPCQLDHFRHIVAGFSHIDVTVGADIEKCHGFLCVGEIL